MAWAFGASERRRPVDWGLSRSPPTLGRLRVVDGMEIARTSSLFGCEHRVPLRALGVIGGGRNFGGCDLGGNEPGEGASGATTASDMDVEEGAAGPRDAAGGADVGAVGGQDGTDPVSTGGEAVVNAGSEYRSGGCCRDGGCGIDQGTRATTCYAATHYQCQWRGATSHLCVRESSAVVRRRRTTSAIREPFVAATPSTRLRLYDCVCSMA